MTATPEAFFAHAITERDAARARVAALEAALRDLVTDCEPYGATGNLRAPARRTLTTARTALGALDD